MTESPVWMPIGSKFSMEQITTKLSALSRITSSSYSFQPSTDSSTRTWWTGERSIPRAAMLLELLEVVGDAAARAAEGEGGPDHRGQARDLEDLLRLLEVRGEAAPRHVEPDPGHGLLEELAVLAHLDRAAAGADQPHAEPVEHAAAGQLDREVERGLPAHGRQERVRALALQDRLEHLRGERLDVGAVRVLRVGHDRGRVRVDERDPQALLLEDLDRLGAGVVELAGLPDHDRPRADHQHRLDGRSLGIGLPSLPARAHHRDELLEEVVAVVGAGAGLRVVLDGEHRAGRAAGSPRPCRRSGSRGSARARAARRARVHAEAVVLRGDLDLAGPQVLDRVVGAAVAELQLVGLAPAGEAEDLVAEADAEDGQPLRRAPSPPRSRTCTARGRRGRSRGRRRPGARASASARAWSRGPRSRRSPRRRGCAGCSASCRSRRRRPGRGASPSRGRPAGVPFRTGTRWRAVPSPSERGSNVQGLAQVTSRARSSPIIDREARAFATSEAWSGSIAETTPALGAEGAQVPGERAGVDLADPDDPVLVEVAVEAPRRPARTRPPSRPRARRSPPPGAAPTRRPRGSPRSSRCGGRSW